MSSSTAPVPADGPSTPTPQDPAGSASFFSTFFADALQNAGLSEAELRGGSASGAQVTANAAPSSDPNGTPQPRQPANLASDGHGLDCGRDAGPSAEALHRLANGHSEGSAASAATAQQKARRQYEVVDDEYPEDEESADDIPPTSRRMGGQTDMSDDAYQYRFARQLAQSARLNAAAGSSSLHSSAASRAAAQALLHDTQPTGPLSPSGGATPAASASRSASTSRQHSQSGINISQVRGGGLGTPRGEDTNLGLRSWETPGVDGTVTPVVDKDMLAWPAKRTLNRLNYSAQEAVENQERLAKAVETILECIGEDPNRPGLKDTPKRYAKALLYLTRGYEEKLSGECAAVRRSTADRSLLLDAHSACRPQTSSRTPSSTSTTMRWSS